MSAYSSQKEVEDHLKDVGIRLISPPRSTRKLLHLLNRVEYQLMKVDQAPSDSMKDALLPIMKAMIGSELLKHADVDVQISVASCMSELSRITAPQQPYNDTLMEEIFQLTLRAFKELSHSGHRYYKALHILEIMADIKACVMLLNLECDTLVKEIFQLFLRIFRPDHPKVVFTRMAEIMTLLIKESDKIPMELLHPLLDSVNKENQIGASKLGEKVLKECASTLKPYLVEALNSTSLNVDDYGEIVSLVCNRMTDREQTVIEPSVGDEKFSKQRAKSKRPSKLTLEVDEDSKDSKRGRITKKYGEEIVGSRIKVWWSLDQVFYEGTVTWFDPVTKKHKIVYDDNAEEKLNLCKELFEFLPSVKKNERNTQVSSAPSRKKKSKNRVSSSKRKRNSQRSDTVF